MKILYDHIAFGQIVGGISRSFIELINQLDSDLEVEIAIKYSRNKYIKKILPLIWNPFGNIYFPYKRRIIRNLNYKFAIFQLINADYDIFHATSDDPYFLPYVKTPYIATVHDLIPEIDPTNSSSVWRKNRKLIFYNASHLIAVSYKTKKDLLLFYPEIEENKVTVIHHGYTNDYKQKTLRNKWGRYILFVGRRSGYKNFARLLDAVAPILLTDKNLKLICTGTKFSSEESLICKRLHIENQAYASEFDELTLNALYRNALVFVFPSLMEGFGLPILEAMGNGCPIALSNIEPFHEIASNAAIYFDPTDTEDIRRKISEIIYNQDFKNKLIQNGYDRLKLYTWENASIKLSQVYRVINQSQQSYVRNN